MSPNNATATAATDEARAISATRVFDAPPDLVFEMWTDPKHLANWWGPRGFSITTNEFAFKPGGVWRFIMHGPDGTDYPNKIVWREIVRPQRIAYSHVSGPPFEASATFTERNGKTEMTMRGTFESAELRDKVAKQFGAVEGMQQTMDRLGEEVANANAFVISRTFDAPRDLIWKAWTEPERMAKWFGPKGVTIIHSKNDLRPQGVYHYGMRTTDGKDMWGKWIYREVVKPRKLVFVNSFSDAKGGITRHPMSPEWPLELLSTIAFDENGGKTTVTVMWAPINASAAERKTFSDGKASMKGGWSGTFDSLETYLRTAAPPRTLTFTRTFNAPRSLVFKAWTDPKQMAKWFGPRGFTTTISEHDARVGGALRIEMRGPDGTVYPGKGVFREVAAPERLVLTTFALDASGKEVLENLNTVTFTERDGKTTLELRVEVVRAAPDAEPFLAGMEQGWTETLERLGELVTSSGR